MVLYIIPMEYAICFLIFLHGDITDMKKFNTTAVCIPAKYYLGDLSDRVGEIKAMVDDGKYFTIHLRQDTDHSRQTAQVLAAGARYRKCTSKQSQQAVTEDTDFTEEGVE